MEEKEYYSAKDIAKKLDCCLSTAYEKIEDLNQLLIQKYPNIVIFEKKIPIWFWNECTKPITNYKEELCKN